MENPSDTTSSQFHAGQFIFQLGGSDETRVTAAASKKTIQEARSLGGEASDGTFRRDKREVAVSECANGRPLPRNRDWRTKIIGFDPYRRSNQIPLQQHTGIH